MFVRTFIAASLLCFGAACGSTTTDPVDEPSDSPNGPTRDAQPEPGPNEPSPSEEPADDDESEDPDEPTEDVLPDDTPPEDDPGDTEPDVEDDPEPQGACTNDADTQTLLTQEDTLEDSISGCVFECFGQDASCSSMCIQNDVGLTEGCSDCFGEVMNCTVSNCAFQCLDTSSAECADCQAQNCDDDFEMCAGVPPQR